MHIIRAEQALLPDGWAQNVEVSVGDDGRIADVAVNIPGAAPAGSLLLPAPANVHSHAFQRAMAGLTEKQGPDGKDSFWTWRDQMFRFVAGLSPDDVESIAALAQMEMLEAGYAAVGEFHYLHHQAGGTAYDDLAEMGVRIAAAASATGIGLCLLPVLYTAGGCDGRAPSAGQRRFASDGRKFRRLQELSARAVRSLEADSLCGAAAHSLRAVLPEDLKRFAGDFPTGPLHMHLAEQMAEVSEVQAHLGARPVRWALDNMNLDDRWCLIHCTQMSAGETEALARTGAVAGLCPVTESSLGDGIFNGTTWYKAGGTIAVGTDSNIRISLTEELRTLEYSQRLRDHRRAVFADSTRSTGRSLFERSLTGGAQATGRQPGLERGRVADLMLLDAGHYSMGQARQDTALDTWIFAAGNGIVRDVWSAGRHMVKEGRHIHRDRIVAGYTRTLARLRDRL
ncbi:formimidoylglutamate deiminase [uncultured Roseobacter sp.]|uniref:formimidoylglutamate deiminase n=1 Tax=uncultured Roseobacter sp. TaxID=114847 RepID=UPI00263198E0|nr:formimidoylglutamate deiminase [uncultured Roseobacter sp.]